MTTTTTHPMPAAPAWTDQVFTEEPGEVQYERTLGKVPASGVLSSRQGRVLTVSLSRTDRASIGPEAVTVEQGEPVLLIGHELLSPDGIRQLADLLTEAVALLDGQQ